MIGIKLLLLFYISESNALISNKSRIKPSFDLINFKKHPFECHENIVCKNKKYMKGIVFHKSHNNEDVEHHHQSSTFTDGTGGFTKFAIRSTIQNAIWFRQLRRTSSSDETERIGTNDAKIGITLTAFIVASGLAILRLGGRAFLVSILGMDFADQNTEMREVIETCLLYVNGLDSYQLYLVYFLSWILVKVLCFDFGGIVLALSAGILFDGVFRGAILASLAATVGSSVSYCIAKLDSPIRDRTLIILQQYPSLNAIKRVIKKDGIKAVFTLRISPIIPIPIGAYNYLYSALDVNFLDFVIGIFLGSLKPYLLDSYLGFYGKEVIDGFAGYGSEEDSILLIALGASALVGFFASQLAAETWDIVNEEITESKKNNNNIFGFDKLQLPPWLLDIQSYLHQSKAKTNELIEIEYKKVAVEQVPSNKVNIENYTSSYYTKSDSQSSSWKDFIKGPVDVLVLAPSLVEAFLKYSDPQFDTMNCSTLRFNDSVEKMNLHQNLSNNKMMNKDIGRKEDIFFLALLGLLFSIFEGNVPLLGDALFWVLGPGLIISGLSFISIGFLNMGENLSPWITPRSNGSLVTHGIFSQLRHPIYAGLNYILVGVSVCSDDAIRLILCFTFWFLMNVIVTREEEILTKTFGSEYELYSEKVQSKFVPEIAFRFLSLSRWYLTFPQ